MSTPLADTAVTPALLLDEVRASRAAADAAEVRILELAVEWAHAHPVLDGDDGWQITSATSVTFGELDGTALAVDPDDPDAEDKVAWCGIPPVQWDAPAQFAAANRMSTGAGKALIRDALILCHRLPKTWAEITAGRVAAWRGRRIAQAVVAAPADVVAYVDDEVATRAGTIGVVTLDRILEAAMLRLHAEALELDQASSVEAHEVRFDDQAQCDGSAEMHVRGDWKDLHDLDRAVADVAAALKRGGDTDPLDARRARALGVLADPAQALALLNGNAAPAPSRQVVVYLHLTDLALLGIDPVATNDTTRREILTQQVHQWLARTDTHVVVKPILDLNESIHTQAYAIPDRLREQTGLINATCVFPWCTRPARSSDLDHIEPWDPDPHDPAGGGGPTSTTNLAPLCRHHHRLKTHTGWSYRRLEPRVFVWTDPTGHHYLHDHGSTIVVDQDRSPD